MRDSADLRSAIKPYEQPSVAASLFQLLNSVGLFVGACALMYWSLHVSYFLTLLLAVPTGGFLVRIFIIQHDCGHGSFFASKWANDLVGRFCSILTVTPYANWRRQHAHHHATWNNLDKRQAGADIYSACLTVGEYRAMTRWQRLVYRVPRHPLLAHIVLPPLFFLLLYRFPFDTPKEWGKERRAVYWLNGALAVVIGALGAVLGFIPVLLVHLPVIVVTTIVGGWLFAVQHRFEESRWERQTQWTFTNASLEGSSYLQLPRILQWFTGNIGFHHIHHFAPRVPNYRLESCYRSIGGLQEKSPLKLGPALAATGLALWDEERQRLVKFKDVSLAAA